jgi:hypothetical protein
MYSLLLSNLIDMGRAGELPLFPASKFEMYYHSSDFLGELIRASFPGGFFFFALFRMVDLCNNQFCFSMMQMSISIGCDGKWLRRKSAPLNGRVLVAVLAAGGACSACPRLAVFRNHKCSSPELGLHLYFTLSAPKIAFYFFCGCRFEAASGPESSGQVAFNFFCGCRFQAASSQIQDLPVERRNGIFPKFSKQPCLAHAKKNLLGYSTVYLL